MSLILTAFELITSQTSEKLMSCEILSYENFILDIAKNKWDHQLVSSTIFSW